MHFVSGDVTNPVKSKAIVLHCVDDSGQWGNGGVFTALSSKAKEPELYYELAGDMGDLNEGDVHLVQCDVSGYKEYHVALVIAQDSKLRVKQALLATCLEKLAHATKGFEGVSVHLPRIGYNTKGFDWYSTERQLRKYLSNRKINTYVYYYRRPKRQSSPPASVAKRARSQSPAASTTANQSDLSPRHIDQSDDDSVSSQSHRIPATPSVQSYAVSAPNDGILENIFTDLNFVIDVSIETQRRKNLKRYIIAYDGDVQSCETESTSFIVCTGPCDLPSGSTAIPVEPDFVFDSICDGRVVTR